MKKYQAGMDSILQAIQNQEHQRVLMQQQDQRLGPGNYDLHSKMQIEMIGSVFYNMLAAVGQKEKDERLIQLSADVKEMLHTRNFDDIVG